MLRCFDIILSIFGLVFGAPIILIALILSYIDTGSPMFLQRRLGQDEKPFVLIKFRTMRGNSAFTVSHLADKSFVTEVGRFLRKTKIDELPQFFNILKGEMTLVGPRPGLPDHFELIRERRKLGVYSSKPGLTGLSQLRKIDMSEPRLLAKTDAEMISSFSIVGYFKYLILTIFGKGSGDAMKKSKNNK